MWKSIIETRGMLDGLETRDRLLDFYSLSIFWKHAVY